jgi:hypothetical protein
MAFDLQAGFGAEGGAQALRQMMLDKLLQQQQTHSQGIEDQKMQLLQAENQRRSEQDKATLAERYAALAETAQKNKVAEASTILPKIPINTAVSPQTTQMADQGGAGDQIYTPPTAAETGSGQPFNARLANPGLNLGTDAQQQAATQQAALESYANAPDTPAPMRGFLRALPGIAKSGPGAAEAAAKILEGPKEPTSTDANYMLGGKPIVAIRQAGRLKYQGQDVTDQVTPYVPPEHPPQDNPNQIHEVKSKDPKTGRSITEYLTTAEVKARQAANGPFVTPEPSAVVSRLTSAAGMIETADDIARQLSDPAVSGKIGPVLGRYNNLKDFLGNPPPEFAELAGEISSYAAAAPGVHGMRSAEMARMIQGALSEKLTPEALAAKIKGFSNFSRHYLSDQGWATNPNVTTPTGPENAPTETPEARRARIRKAAGL